MGIYKYIKMTFIDDMKKSIFFMFVLIVSITIIFNIFNITFNEQIVPRGSDEYISMSALGFIIMFVSIVFTAFANSYYMEDKYKEYAIISVSGRKISDICKIMIVRSFIVTSISVFMGCFLGWILSPFIIELLNKLIDVKVSMNGISRDAVITTVLMMASEIEAIFLFNIGAIYRSNINDLIKRNKKNYIKDKRIIKINPIVYLILYVIPIIIMFIPISSKEKLEYIKVTSIIGLLGIQGLVRYVIPDWIKNNRRTVDKYKIIKWSNLYTSIQKSIVLILTLVLSIIFTIEIGTGYGCDSFINNISVFCYILIILIMSFTLVYKFLIEGKTRKNNFEQLKLLGYTSYEIKKIIFKEVISYYFIIVLLVMPYNIVLIASNVMAGLITLSRAEVMIGLYIILFASTAIISYKGYSKAAL